MIYVANPPRSGKVAAMQCLTDAVKTLIDVFRRIAEGIITENGEDDPTEDEEMDLRWSLPSCDLPSLPRHQIPWYTTGFQ